VDIRDECIRAPSPNQFDHAVLLSSQFEGHGSSCPKAMGGYSCGQIALVVEAIVQGSPFDGGVDVSVRSDDDPTFSVDSCAQVCRVGLGDGANCMDPSRHRCHRTHNIAGCMVMDRCIFRAILCILNFYCHAGGREENFKG